MKKAEFLNGTIGFLLSIGGIVYVLKANEPLPTWLQVMVLVTLALFFLQQSLHELSIGAKNLENKVAKVSEDVESFSNNLSKAINNSEKSNTDGIKKD